MNPQTRLTTMRLALVLAILFAGTASADVLKVGDRAAELDVAVDAGGKAIKLKSFKDKWVLVTAGAGWCKPCAKELPAWDKLAPQWKEKVSFIAVDLDEEIADGKAFHKKLKLKNMTLVYLSPDSAVAAKYGSDHIAGVIQIYTRYQ